MFWPEQPKPLNTLASGIFALGFSELVRRNPAAPAGPAARTAATARPAAIREDFMVRSLARVVGSAGILAESERRGQADQETWSKAKRKAPATARSRTA